MVKQILFSWLVFDPFLFFFRFFYFLFFQTGLKPLFKLEINTFQSWIFAKTIIQTIIVVSSYDYCLHTNTNHNYYNYHNYYTTKNPFWYHSYNINDTFIMHLLIYYIYSLTFIPFSHYKAFQNIYTLFLKLTYPSRYTLTRSHSLSLSLAATHFHSLSVMPLTLIHHHSFPAASNNKQTHTIQFRIKFSEKDILSEYCDRTFYTCSNY